MRRRLGVVAILLSLVVARPAGADVEKSRAHYDRGRSYFQVGEYRKALEEFKNAHVEKNDPAYIYNIAECHRQLGEPKEAAIFYRRFLGLVPPGHPLRSDANRRIVELEQPAPGAPPVAQTGPSPAPAPPVAQAPLPVPGVVVAQPVPVQPLPPPTAPQPAPVSPVPAVSPVPPSSNAGAGQSGAGGSRRTAAYVVGGVSMLALGIGAYFGFDARSKWKESEPLCPADQCDDRGYSLSQDAGTSALVADITIGAGLVGAGVATYLLLTSRGETPPAQPIAWRLRVQPEIAPHRRTGLIVGTSW
jgi:hypothetical protein